MNPKFFRRAALAALLALGVALPAQTPEAAKAPGPRIPDTYRPSRRDIYRKGWIDFNKNGRKDVYEDPSARLEDRIEDLLARMTLEEKTCQMVTLYGYQRVLSDDLPTPAWKEKLWKDGIGAIDEHLNGFRQWGLPPSDNPNVWPASRHAWALNEVQRFFVEETRLGIPVDFTNEGIRGVESYIATDFPTPLALGHTWNRDLVRRVGRITGREARLLGYTNIYAPVLDVGRDQRWGRYEEVYGESPYLVAELGIEMARGLQHDFQVAATAKHFVGYSNNKGAREGLARVDPQMSPRELEMIHVYPWRRVVAESCLLGVMSSYNDYDGLPVQSSRHWLTDRLRGEFGFRGYIVSDSDAVEYLHAKHRTARDMSESVRQSVEAGLNVRCTFRSPESYVLPLRELVRQGALSMSTVDDRVRDILRVKFLVGLFDRPYQTDLARADREVYCAEHREVALEAARQGLVLLRNEGGLLPLARDSVRRIAVCGPNADEKAYALTHYGPLAADVTTVLEGIRRKVRPGTEVLYARGCALVDDHWPESEIIPYPLTAAEQAAIDSAAADARRSDVAVVVLGGGPRTCGENKSRSSLDLPGRQLDLLQAVAATGTPVVVVLVNGRPLSVNWADRFVPAILEAWYPGAEGGTAVAEALFGDYNPGGKLTVTFPRSVGQLPFNFPSKPYAQVDGGRTPGPGGNMSRVNGALYPFGHGLSYTTFEYSGLDVSPAVVTPLQTVEVRCRVKNTGPRAGDEVVQLYVRDEVSSVTTYEKRLAGFERVHLAPGESRELTFTVHPRDLELIDADGRRRVEPGDFRVMVGASSADIRLDGRFAVAPYGEHTRRASAGMPAATASGGQGAAALTLDGRASTSWRGAAGDALTYRLDPGAAPDRMEIIWSECSADAEFEIQLSGGGGQFLTVCRGRPGAPGDAPRAYTFGGTTASDARLLIVRGSVGVAEVRVPGLAR